MPKINSKITLTDCFLKCDIEKLNIQEASKFLLRCMKYLYKKENKSFIYSDLVTFMQSNYNNATYYIGKGIKSKNYIIQYWNYARSPLKSTYIPQFDNYMLLKVKI